MFIYDIPIKEGKDDFLSRTNFAEALADTVLDWEGTESLVIALYGEWGSGKTSILNMTKSKIDQSNLRNKPTIIDFNPWLFSDLNNLTKNFFLEIAKELGSDKKSSADKKLSKKIKQYSNILNLVPEKSFFSNLSSKFLILMGIFGVTSSQILEMSKINMTNLKLLSFICGFLFLLIEFLRELFKRALSYLDDKINAKDKSINAVRAEIRANLLNREKKLLLFIDDIDRLTPDEIREIFRLVKSNIDFPNTIFLLAFDRRIIEKNLEMQPGISGKNYLEKIVQVNFDIPYALPHKISQFLFKELDKILLQLPKTSENLFDNTYWTNIYHSGFKYFFTNIRDIKRYINSVSFNISMLYKNNSLEVNPIDFFAIEAIRVFIPELYSFIKKNKRLFIDVTANGYTLGTARSDLINQRKSAIEEQFNSIQEQSYIKELIIRMFPQLEGVFGNIHYSNSSKSEWNRYLRICSEDYFDAYFTLIPGGSDEELSQYEIESLLACSADTDAFENELTKAIANGKIRKILSRFQDYTSRSEIIPQTSFRSICLALFNISDLISFEIMHMSDFGASMDIMRIIYQLGKREQNKEANYQLLKEIIPISKGIHGPVQRLSFEIRNYKSSSENDYLIPEDKLEELKQITCKKIYDFSKTSKFINHPEFLYILYRWKEWGGNAYKEFIENLKNSDEGYILLISKFIYKQRCQSAGDYGERVKLELNRENIKDFFDFDDIKKRLSRIIDVNPEIYNMHKKEIDFIIAKL